MEKVFVKEEVDCEVGVSEAAARAGLYDGHEVKNELVIGPEMLQTLKVTSAGHDCGLTDIKTNMNSQSDIPLYVKIEPVEIKIETESIEEDPLLEQTDVWKHDTVDASSTDVFLKSLKLVTHMQTHAEVDDKTSGTGLLQRFQTEHFVCDLCSKSFETKSKLITHLKDQRRSHCMACRQHLSCESHLDSNDESYTKFSCKFCERIFKADRSLFDMERSWAGISYRCKTCKHTFKRQNLAYRCDVCKKRFTTKFSLKNHIRIHTGERPYSCKKCKQRFTSLSILTRHQQVHQTVKPFTCDVCHKKFTRKYSLIYHMRFHTGKELFKCDICAREFISKSHLVEHRRTHTGERPYRCDICGKNFLRKSDLHTHGRVHTGEKPYECQICCKRFKQVSALRTHERRFNGQTPLICDICDKRFCYQYYLKLHKQYHAENGEFDSDSEQEQKWPLLNREDTKKKAPKCITYSRVQKGEMFPCGVCGKQFTKQSSLSQHAQLLHSLIVKQEPSLIVKTEPE